MVPVFFLYAITFLTLCFFLLPVAIVLRVDRHPSVPLFHLRLDTALFRGLFGISLSYRSSSWRLYPLLLGWPLTFLPLRSGKKKASPSTPAAPSPRTEPPPDDSTPSPAEEKASPPLVKRLTDLSRRFLGPGLDLLGALPLVIRLKKLHLCGSFGFDDPARTGSLFGFLQSSQLSRGKRLRLDITPDFTRSGIRGRLDLVMHLRLGYLLLLLCRFLLQVVYRWLTSHLPWLPWKPRFV